MKYIVKYLILIIVLSNFKAYSQTTIISYNIRYDSPHDNENQWDKRKNEVVGLIEKYHPDFLGIQEGLNHQVEYIKQEYYKYEYIGFGRDDGAKKGEYSAIFYDTTRFELFDSKTFWLSESPNIISVGWDASMLRICTFGIFIHKYTRDSIAIFNGHFDHIGAESRKMSAKLILQQIHEFALNEMKIIVMGDFNSEPESEALNILTSSLEDGIQISKKKFTGPIGTFNQFDNKMIPQRRIDYILTKNLTVSEYKHIEDKRVNGLCISDHLPVYIKIE